MRKQKSIFEALIQEGPSDAEVWYEYSQTLAALKDKPAELKALKRAYTLNPKHPDAGFVFAIVLAQQNQVAQGLQVFTKAMNACTDVSRIRNYGQRMAETLTERNHNQDASYVRKKVAEKTASTR